MKPEEMWGEMVRLLGQLVAGRAERERQPLAPTLEHAAELLDVSVSTLRVMIRRGEVRTVTIGKRPHVPLAEVRRLSSLSDEPTQEQEAPTAASIPHRQARDIKAEADQMRALARKKRR